MKIDHMMQEKLKQFYKEETSWFPDHVGLTFCAFLILGITMIWWALMEPDVSALREDRQMLLIMGCMEGFGYGMLRKRFFTYNEGKETCILELLRYAPVAKEQLLIFVWKKQLWHMRWRFVTAFLLQFLFGAVIWKHFTVWSVLIPFFGCVLAPVFWEVLAAVVFWHKS